jgi:hypothetical protein
VIVFIPILQYNTIKPKNQNFLHARSLIFPCSLPACKTNAYKFASINCGKGLPSASTAPAHNVAIVYTSNRVFGQGESQESGENSFSAIATKRKRMAEDAENSAPTAS